MPHTLRRSLALLTAALLAAGLLDAPAAQANPGGGERPPRSGRPGLTPPNVATDLIRTNMVIGPREGENFPAFTVVGVQLVPMMKVLRDGSIDPDHAIAHWFFTVKYPRNSNYWPPFLPEPTNPWRWHFYEMPDGGLTGIGPAEQGSPLYTPPPNLPQDWMSRMIAAAREGIPQGTFDAAVNDRVEDVDNTGNLGDAPPGEQEPCPAAFGLDDQAPCEEGERVAQAFADAGLPAPGPANPGVPGAPRPGGLPPGPMAELCAATASQMEACLTAMGVAGAIISKLLEKRTAMAMTTLVPCFGQTAEVIGWMAAAEGLLIVAAFKPAAGVARAFLAIALVAFGWGMVQFAEQVRICGLLIQLATSGGLWAPYVAAAAAMAIALSTVAILAVTFTVGQGIDVVQTWWGGDH